MRTSRREIREDICDKLGNVLAVVSLSSYLEPDFILMTPDEVKTLLAAHRRILAETGVDDD